MKTENVNIPRRATVDSAGYDFYAPEDIVLVPGQWTSIDTGVSLDDSDFVRSCGEDVKDWFMILVPRSGLGVKYGVKFRNTLGVIDQGYRDNIRACLTTDVPYTILKGERFMQGIIIPFGIFNNEDTPTKERNGGHGSSGRF